MASLQTTATLDKETDEFVIHTPNPKATKYWPGSMGRSGNFAVVFARLIIDGDDYSVQPFLVPIRDRETHVPFRGVKVGDIGPKFGYNTVDNGWM